MGLYPSCIKHPSRAMAPFSLSLALCIRYLLSIREPHRGPHPLFTFPRFETLGTSLSNIDLAVQFENNQATQSLSTTVRKWSFLYLNFTSVARPAEHAYLSQPPREGSLRTIVSPPSSLLHPTSLHFSMLGRTMVCYMPDSLAGNAPRGGYTGRLETRPRFFSPTS